MTDRLIRKGQRVIAAGIAMIGTDPPAGIKGIRNPMWGRSSTCRGLFTRPKAAFQATAGRCRAPHAQNSKLPILGGLANGLLEDCPCAMFFRRSPSGMSHHPDESVQLSDVEAGLQAGVAFIEALP